MQIEHRMDAKRGNLIWLSDGRTEVAAALDFGIRSPAPGMSTTARESVHDREGGAYPDESQSADRTGGRLGRLHAPRRRDGPDPVPRRDGGGIYARPRPVALGPDVARG